MVEVHACGPEELHFLQGRGKCTFFAAAWCAEAIPALPSVERSSGVSSFSLLSGVKALQESCAGCPGSARYGSGDRAAFHRGYGFLILPHVGPGSCRAADVTNQQRGFL